ncbi:MAG TPA: M23 family metallopeptidase [Streptosporangiaceae bacterium]
MSRRKPSRGGSSLLPRVNRISTLALVTNLGLVVVVSAIVERTVLAGSGVPAIAAGAPNPAALPAGHARPARASRESRAPIRLAALTTTVKEATLAQRGPQARRTYGTKTTGQPIVERTRSTKTWTFGTSALPPPKGSPAIPEVSLYLARVVGDRWQVAFAGTPAFTALLKTAPAALLLNSERQLLARYNSTKASAASTNTNDLMLPWKQGQPWSLVADQYGVGFDGGDGKVLAAADGRIYRFCTTSSGGGLILLIHPNGLASEYYQLTAQPERAAGSLVKRGEYLGKAGTDHPCGGGSAEPQVRFALRHADQAVSIAGHAIGGWTFHVGTDLDRYVAVHGDQQVLPGEQVINLGVPGLPGLPGADASNAPDLPQLPVDPSKQPLLPTPAKPPAAGNGGNTGNAGKAANGAS